MSKIVQYKEVEEELSRLYNLVGNLNPFWDRVVPLLHNTTMSKFAKAGPGWAALAPSTIRQRIQEGSWRGGVGSDQPILLREGDLRRSVMAASSGGSNHIEQKSPTKLVYGTSMQKARYLQGDLDKWIPGAAREYYSTKLPPRPFLWLSDRDIQDILIQARTYMEEAFLRG